MNEKVRVPIRVRRPGDGADREVTEKSSVAVEAEPAVVDPRPVATEESQEVDAPQEASMRPSQAGPEETEALRTEEVEAGTLKIEALKDDVEMWRDRALRLQAEIENFRKRQRRLAQERIQADQARLLRNFLAVADDLERALEAEGGDGDALRPGVKVTHRSLNQLLKQEGVERIAAEGEVFDPTWHEAVGTIPHSEVGADKDTIVNVTQSGYRLDGRLLRPARVIVAK